MSCAPCLPCVVPEPCGVENFGLQFPSLRGPAGAPGSTVLFAANYAAARLLNMGSAIAGTIVNVGGHTSINDGGEGQFNYDPTSAVADNGGTVLDPVGPGRLVRIFDGPTNVDWFHARGDGATNDQAAIQAAVNASVNGEVMFQPGKIYAVSTEVLFNANLGKLAIVGYGAGIKAIGGTNKCIHISGTISTNVISIRGLQFGSGTGGVCAAGLHLENIAHFLVKDCSFIDGLKMAKGIQCTGAQQGEIAGCKFFSDTGLYLETGVGAESNGIETHGCTFSSSTACAVLRADTGWFHGNHLTGGAQCIDVTSLTGQYDVTDNHVEPVGGANKSILLRSGGSFVAGNSLFGQVGTLDIRVMAAAGNSRILGNQINSNVTIDAGAGDVMFAFNETGGTCTDNGTRTRNFSNRAFGGTAFVGSQFYDAFTINSPTVGNMLRLIATIAGHNGLKIEGAGVNQDIFVDFGHAAICGNTGGGPINFKSAPGGVQWGAINVDALISVGSLVSQNATPFAVTGPNEVAISGGSQATVGAAGAAAALPATPSGYLKIRRAGTAYVIPYYLAA